MVISCRGDLTKLQGAVRGKAARDTIVERYKVLQGGFTSMPDQKESQTHFRIWQELGQLFCLLPSGTCSNHGWLFVLARLADFGVVSEAIGAIFELFGSLLEL